MSSINKHSTISFLLSAFFSKVLFPFLGLLYVSFSLKNFLDSNRLWILSSFSFLSFGLIQLSFLKDTRMHYSRKDLWFLGLLWVTSGFILRLIFEPFSLDAFCIHYPLLYITLGLFLTPRVCGIYARQWTL